jgi:integrase
MARTTNDRGLRWGEGYVTPRGDKFQARWPETQRNGAVKWRAKSFSSNDDAEEHLRTVARAKRTGRYAPPSELTVTDLIAEHIERARDRLTPRAIVTYQDRARRMIEPQIGSRRVADLRSLDVQRWVDQLRATYQPSTIRAAFAVLSGACREAVALGIIDRNPTIGVRHPTQWRPPMQTWTEDQARRVLTIVDRDPIFGALYHVALATAMRPGELRALTWSDIDWENSRVSIRRTMTRDDAGEHSVSRTKTGRERKVRLPAPVLTRLKLHRSQQAARRLARADWHDHDLVFDRGDGHWLWQSHWLRVHIQLCTEAGVPRIRHHDLRHTAATLMIEAGESLKIVSEILGHRSISTTMDIYVHPGDDAQRAVVDRLGERLFGNTTTSVETGTE